MVGGVLRPAPLAPGTGDGEQQVGRSMPREQRPGAGNPLSLRPFTGGDDLQPQQQPDGTPGAAETGPDAEGYAAEGEGVMPQLLQQNESLTAMHEKLETSAGRLEKVMAGLTRLGMLGDTVMPKDIVDEAEKFVIAGISATTVGKVLSSMPVDSQEGLAGWVGQMGQEIGQSLAVTQQALKNSGHDLASNGMKLLLASQAQENSAKMTQGGAAADSGADEVLPSDGSGAPTDEAPPTPPSRPPNALGA